MIKSTFYKKLKALLILTHANSKMVLLDALPSGDSETHVPSTLWFHHHQLVAFKSAAEKHCFSCGNFFMG